MRLLFAANELHFPDNMGGSRMDTHDLALTFRDHGHEVAVLAQHPGRNRLLGYPAVETLTRKSVLSRSDDANGYQTIRCGFWQVPRLLRESMTARPADLVITQGPGAAVLAQVASRHGVRTAVRLTSAAEVELLAAAAHAEPRLGAVLRSPLVTLVAVSGFIAGMTMDSLGVPATVIYPPIRLHACVAGQHVPDYITFVNPIPMKGLAVAAAVAELLPQRRFLFVEAWNISAAEREARRRLVSDLPNVVFQRRSVGLAEVYGATAVLLVPSQCPEAFSRVVVEACANGIPVLASRVGGVPEAMGGSGVLLGAADPPERWAEAIERILAEHDRRASLAVRARANAQRAEFGMPRIIEQYLALARAEVTQPG